MGGVIIIGSGLAGYTLAKELRKLSPDMPLSILSADDGAFYSKPLLSNALAKGKTAETLPTASAVQMAEQLKATIMPHTRVTAIDTAARTVTAEGVTHSYDQLVLCTGAEPLRAPLDGDGPAAVLSVNNLADYAMFRAALEQAERIAILGPGLIGCEFANDLVGVGKRVAVIGPDAAPLGRLMPPACGLFLQRALQEAGVEWHLGVTAGRVQRSSRGFAITLSNDAVVEADCVLSAIGLRPGLALAQQAGLRVHRGIVVDRHLQTSASDVYALGDCAEVEGRVLPYVMPIMHAARALAQTLSGAPTVVSYPAMPVVVKTPACPVVVSPPAADASGHWDITPMEKGVRGLYRTDDGRLLGMALVGHAATERQQWSKDLPPVLA